MNAIAARLLTGRPGPGPGEGVGHVFAGQVGGLDEETIRLAGLIDAGFLAEAGWDPVTRTLTLAVEHRLLGRRVCAAPGCRTTCGQHPGVCLECRRRLDAAGLSLADVGLLPPPRG